MRVGGEEYEKRNERGMTEQEERIRLLERLLWRALRWIVSGEGRLDVLISDIRETLGVRDDDK